MEIAIYKQLTGFRASHRKDDYFIRSILFVCIACLLNTLFFSIVKRSGLTDEQLSAAKSQTYQTGVSTTAKKVKIAKSLLRFILESYVSDTEQASDDNANISETLYRMDYIPPFYKYQIYVPFAGEVFQAVSLTHSFKNPFLECLTPPPKPLV